MGEEGVIPQQEIPGEKLKVSEEIQFKNHVIDNFYILTHNIFVDKKVYHILFFF